MSLTASQKTAIAARGNVLVVAGAGTGKTRTLVERCLDCLLAERPRVSLDEILMVTFTEAAAAEMRQRIRERVEEEAARHPDDPQWQEQLALFETAHIGTLHSFCLELVRQHFYELGLDPQLAVMPEEEARLLADETLEKLLQKHYAGRGAAAEAVQRLIQAQGQGRDEPIRNLVLRLHHYTQSVPDPPGWLERQLTLFADPEPTLWRSWLLQALTDWRSRWLADLGKQPAENDVASQCAAELRTLPVLPARDQAARVLTQILVPADQCPHGKKTTWVQPLKEFLAEAEFLLSVTEMNPAPVANESIQLSPTGSDSDPLAQDWAWVRDQMTALLQLARDFTSDFTEAKRELGMVDFRDLEQHALRLLWNVAADEPTPVARQWRDQLRFVFVDEYQDINAAQDKIIEALSRPGAEANRFLVGDVKQSIYRFRLANPYIFQGYVRKWGQSVDAQETASGLLGSAGLNPAVRVGGSRPEGQVIALTDNFRSREGVLEFINSLFGLLMGTATGGVPYDEQARLRFGAPHERRALSKAESPSPAVELHLRVKSANVATGSDDERDEARAEITELEEAAKDARLVALRLIELKQQHQPVWDDSARHFRPVEWRDIAVLLRSPANKAESYAKEFARLAVPLQVVRAGFYRSLEISDLLSLLQVLDNPLQDLPLLAVLHSPLVGLNLDELAAVRLALPRPGFWSALVRWDETHRGEGGAALPGGDSGSAEPSASAAPQSPIPPEPPQLQSKVATFLSRFARWRRLAREVPLSRCLEAILAETHYAEWLVTQPQGEQRRANLRRLSSLAQDFDRFQRQGLFRFLRFIEAQQSAETGPEVPPVAEENAVRLMSIHQSKGLEFPVVVVADLGKSFNLADLRAEIILDENYGVCPHIKPPHATTSYPSLPYWLARRQQHRELLGEELRLLYVATTRARDLLLLSGSVAKSRFEKIWQAPTEPSATGVMGGRSYADWLGLWFYRQVGAVGEGVSQGEVGSLRWALHDDTRLLTETGSLAPDLDGAKPPPASADPDFWRELERRLTWHYPFTAAARHPAKTSVSALRRQANLDEDESSPFFPVLRERPAVLTKRSGPASATSVTSAPPATLETVPVSAAEVGLAHHRFLQLVALDQTSSVASLKREAKRLEEQGALLPGMYPLLDFKALAGFWSSEPGRKIRAQAQHVRRELAFTARFAADELARVTGQPGEAGLSDEFVVVQGVADLAVIRPEEIWLVDFKTDALSAGDVEHRAKVYEPQVQLYASALSRIYARPVTECWLYFLAVQAAVSLPALSAELANGHSRSPAISCA